MGLENDKLSECSRCKGDACYTQVVNNITLYSCYGCGFQTSTIMKKGEEFFEEQLEILPELYKSLLGEDEEGRIWMPQTVNLPQQGMVFASTAKEYEEKYPIPHKTGEFYEWRMDMTTEKRFPHNDFVEALDYIGIFGEAK